MKKALLLLTMAAVLTMVAAPALAAPPFQTIYEEYNRSTQQGQALIHIDGDMYAWIVYEDTDGSGDYSAGDKRIRMKLVRLLET